MYPCNTSDCFASTWSFASAVCVLNSLRSRLRSTIAHRHEFRVNYSLSRWQFRNVV